MALGADAGTIRQNGPALSRVSQRLGDIAREFEQNYQAMYDLIRRSLGNPDEETKIWYGPRAAGCRNLAERQYDKFEQMKSDLKNLAETIEAQAITWGQQQNRKY